MFWACELAQRATRHVDLRDFIANRATPGICSFIDFLKYRPEMTMHITALLQNLAHKLLSTLLRQPGVIPAVKDSAFRGGMGQQDTCPSGKVPKGFIRSGVAWLSVVSVLAPLLVFPGAVQGATARTATTLTSSHPTVKQGGLVTFTVTVAGTNPTGTVTLKDGAKALGSKALSGTGNTKTLKFGIKTLKTGTHSMKAVYSGDVSNASSTSAVLTQTVAVSVFAAMSGPSLYSTTTIVSANINASNVGQAVTFKAEIIGDDSALDCPDGTVTFKDGGTVIASGVAINEYCDGVAFNSSNALFTTSALSAGLHYITATYSGGGDSAGSTSLTYYQTVNSPAPTSTSTSVSSSTNPSTFGAAVAFTATVSGSQTPTGAVTFMDGATTIGTATLTGSGNTKTATLSTAALSVAAHSITAAYSGDTLNAASTSAALTQTVNPASTSTNIYSSWNPSKAGDTVTFTATVNGYAPTGAVTFKDGASTIGVGTLSGGSATFTTSGMVTLGTHAMTAVYSGDGSNQASTSGVLTQTVTKGQTWVSVASNANPSAPGSAVTFTAAVTNVSGLPITGTVTFQDGATAIGTGTVAAGSATLTTSSLASGSHSITAVYGGDTQNLSGTSGAIAQTVNSPSATSTSVSSSANPSGSGASITFVAMVTGTNPTGAVTFMDGGTTLGTGGLSGSGNSRSASYTTAAMASGSHSITAQYGGDTGNASSTSSALTQSVNPASSSTSVSSSVNPSMSGAAVTFTATVYGNAPTGTVTFMDGAPSAMAVVNVSAGSAVFTTSTLTVGAHTITAVYSGDTSNASSTSANLIQTVNNPVSATLQSYGVAKPCATMCGVIGAMVQSVALDVAIGGVPVVLTYNSSLNKVATLAGLTPLTFGQNLALGPFWSSNFHKNLRIDSAGAAVQVFQGDSFVLSFIKNASGVYVADADVSASLVAVTGGYRFNTGSSLETYSSAGVLTSIEFIKGAKLTFNYSGGVLVSVTDINNKSISFDYTNARLTSVTAQDAKSTGLAYNANGYLYRVTWPDASTRTFLYENATYPWAMTGVTGEDGLRKQTNAYDSSGALSYTELGTPWIGRVSWYTAAGVSTTAVPVADPATGYTTSVFSWTAPSTADVITGTGTLAESTLTLAQGLPRDLQTTTSPGAGSTAAVITKTLDTAANPTSVVKSDGYKSCNAYGALSRVLASVVGVSAATDCSTVTAPGSTLPAGVQATYLTWHDTWALPTQVWSGQSLVNLAYNGSVDAIGGGTASCASGLPNMSNGMPVPVLCKRYTRAVTATMAPDTTTPTLVESFVYDNKGRMTSSTDVRGFSTSYLYNTDGLLQKVTDSLNFFWTNDAYDLAGRLLQSTDKNGVVTTRTYASRGWLATSTVTPPGKPAQTTTVVTKVNGTVDYVVDANGVQTTYTYDSNDRLTQVQRAGGIVVYDLDKDGYVLAETYKNLAGNVLRTVTRQYDQLGRMAKIIGVGN